MKILFLGTGAADWPVEKADRDEHNNLAMVLEMKKTLGKRIKQFCISNMATTLHTDHETLTDEMAKHGIEVAYDGFCKEI